MKCNKKIWIYILLVASTFMAFTNNVMADFGQDGHTDDPSAIVGSTKGDCGVNKVCRANYWGGVRITYINNKGEDLSDSFDFISNKQGVKYTTFLHNSAPRKSKLHGTASIQNVAISSIPMLKDLVATFNSICSAGIKNEAGEVMTCKASPYNPHTTFNFNAEQKWFNSLTLSTLSENQYNANVQALGQALSKFYSFNYEQMKTTMVEACSKGEQIFIQMEPLFTTVNGHNGFLLGSVRDQMLYYSSTDSAKFSNLIYKLNYWGFSSLMYYGIPLQVDNFTAYTVLPNGKYQFTGTGDLTSPAGYDVILDWGNNMKKTCAACKFENGVFVYNDKKVEAADYAGKYPNIYEYATAPASEGGLGCCGTIAEAIAKRDPHVTDELKEYYDYYCSATCEPCTEKEYKYIDKGPVYCCPNGQECDKNTWREECGKPCNDEDPVGSKCCEEDPIEPGYIEGEVNNCCADGTISKAREYDLDDLFCDNEYLGVSNYHSKCEINFYQEDVSDDDLPSEYCKMYCTERIEVEIPGAITAISGRYFKLESTSRGTTSSYIEGYKRCRVRIQYDNWERDYYNVVEEEKEAYNQFQEDKAYQLLYEKAEKEVISGVNETSNISCSCKCSYVKNDGPCGGDPDPYDCPKTHYHSATASGSCTITYNKYPFNKMFDIFPVKIDQDKRDDCEDIYEAIEFKEATSYKTQHEPWSSWEIEESIAACNQKTQSMQVTKSWGNDCSCTLACSRTITEGEKHIENVHEVRQQYNDMADSDNESYNSAADRAKELEETIDTCDKYFTEYHGADAEANYQLNTEQHFSYTQIYLDEFRDLQLEEVEVDFESEPGCVIDPNVVTGPDGEDNLAADQYSTKYGTGQEKMTDFKNSKLEYEKTATGYRKYHDETYDADKIFTTDAKYHGTCQWNEGENTLYTLVPSGSAEDTKSVPNYTEHNKEYRVFLSTLEGTYETHWDLMGLGSPRNDNSGEGRFDQYFRDAGQTCANEDPNDVSMLSCKLHSEHEVVLTGYCNGSNGSDTTVDPDDCDPYSEGYRLFNFKVVDPANLFPSGTNTIDGPIAYNWVSTSEGRQAMSEIQAVAERDLTYAPENLTYSFILTPTDMGHIKDYNASRTNNREGGYSDFTLNCSKSSCEAGACSQCKSPFLENLANGQVVINNTSYRVSGWANPDRDLAAVRRYYGWN